MEREVRDPHMRNSPPASLSAPPRHAGTAFARTFQRRTHSERLQRSVSELKICVQVMIVSAWDAGLSQCSKSTRALPPPLKVYRGAAYSIDRHQAARMRGAPELCSTLLRPSHISPTVRAPLGFAIRSLSPPGRTDPRQESVHGRPGWQKQNPWDPKRKKLPPSADFCSTGEINSAEMDAFIGRGAEQSERRFEGQQLAEMVEKVQNMQQWLKQDAERLCDGSQAVGSQRNSHEAAWRANHTAQEANMQFMGPPAKISEPLSRRGPAWATHDFSGLKPMRQEGCRGKNGARNAFTPQCESIPVPPSVQQASTHPPASSVCQLPPSRTPNPPLPHSFEPAGSIPERKPVRGAFSAVVQLQPNHKHGSVTGVKQKAEGATVGGEGAGLASRQWQCTATGCQQPMHAVVLSPNEYKEAASDAWAEYMRTADSKSLLGGAEERFAAEQAARRFNKESKNGASTVGAAPY